jgi:hypothetical protein
MERAVKQVGAQPESKGQGGTARSAVTEGELDTCDLTPDLGVTEGELDASDLTPDPFPKGKGNR